MRLLERSVLLLVLLVLIWRLLVSMFNTQGHEMLEYSGSSCVDGSTSRDPILVLSWTAMNHRSNDSAESWFGPTTSQSFDVCYEKGYLPESMKCVYTNDKYKYDESDVIMFRGRKLDTLRPPPYKLPEQQWVFWEFEPPYKVWEYSNLTKYNGLFNLTATYARDSDIPNIHELNRICMRDHEKHYQLRHTDYTTKKRKDVPVAWLASVCHTQSKREKYIKELKRWIPVDIYGLCGDKKCGSFVVSTWKVDKCDEKLFHYNNSYKFYLAFENSLCDDYVTEKLWRMQNVDAVPIVMGKVDYSKILPKDSYIDVRDFESPRELAEFLKVLSKDDDRYNQYLRNKNSLKCTILHEYKPWQCNLCQRLHELRNTRKVVHNLDHYWGSRRCVSQKELLRSGKNPDWNFDFK